MLIILDDFSLQNLRPEVRLTLLQLREDRDGKKRIVIVSQLSGAKWYDFVNEPLLGAAIPDRSDSYRMTSNAQRIDLKGESSRRKK